MMCILPHTLLVLSQFVVYPALSVGLSMTPEGESDGRGFVGDAELTIKHDLKQAAVHLVSQGAMAAADAAWRTTPGTNPLRAWKVIMKRKPKLCPSGTAAPTSDCESEYEAEADYHSDPYHSDPGVRSVFFMSKRAVFHYIQTEFFGKDDGMRLTELKVVDRITNKRLYHIEENFDTNFVHREKARKLYEDYVYFDPFFDAAMEVTESYINTR